jgi:methyl-accepting chemotaxis protein
MLGLLLAPEPVVVIGGLGVALAALCISIILHARVHRQMQDANAALGAFIRGNLDARIHNISGVDAWDMLRHRLNNLLDIADLSVREREAAVDTGEDEAYLTKIKTSGLAVKLHERANALAVLDIPQSLNVTPLMNRIEELQRSLYKLQHSTRDMLLKAATNQVSIIDDTLALAIRKTVEYTRVSPSVVKQLHQASEKLASVSLSIDQLAERGDIVALNLAISSANSGGDERLNQAVNSVKHLSEQVRQANQEIAKMIEASQASASAAMRTIYDMASLVHQVHQAQHHSAQGQSYQASDRVMALSEARHALAAADTLNHEAERLSLELRHINEAA